MKRSAVLSVTALAATGALALSGCGSSSTAAAPTSHASGTAGSSLPPMTSVGPGAPGPHDQADVTFATDMIPHHAQAVQMADMAAAKATNSQVKALAADIKADQNPEISQMTGWLTGWGQSVPSTTMPGMGSSPMTGMAGMTGTGMMSDTDMAALDAASGAAFDRRWVQMMVQHHTGAVSMARTELAAGQNTTAKALAQSIVTSQTAQIGQLQNLLTQLPT